MRVARLHGIRDVRIHQEDKPSPGAGECLVEVKAVTICGSDLHIYAEGNVGGVGWDRPFIPCHEFAAICRGGQRIPDGTKVVADPALPCEQCDMCLRGWGHLCRNLVFCGLPPCEGAVREFIAWPERNLFPLPDSLSDADGVMLEPLGIALHAVDLAHLRVGMNVGVFGCGPIGLLIVQLARLAGADKIIATDVLQHRVDAARGLGANQAIFAADRCAVREVAEAAGSHGLDVAFEVAGENEAVEDAVIAARPGGKVMLVGIPARSMVRKLN